MDEHIPHGWHKSFALKLNTLCGLIYVYISYEHSNSLLVKFCDNIV